jgi:hypothetical protein
MANSPTAQDIIDRWPSRAEMAKDVGRPVIVVHRWWQRSSIPAKYDTRLLDAASARNIPLNWRELMDARSPNSDQHGQSGEENQAPKMNLLRNLAEGAA